MTEQDGKFPSAVQALLLIAALFVVEVIVGSVLQDLQGVLELTSSQSWALTSLVANGCVFATVMQLQGMTYRELFHPAGTSMRQTAIALVPWVVMLVPALVLVVSVLITIETRAFPLSDSERALFDRMSGDDLATTLLTCAIAPVVEEMLFRGVILRGFLRRYSRSHAIWASAALFGLAHQNIYQFVVWMLLGGLCGWLYERSRSLVPCIALHASYNTALALLAHLPSGADDDADLSMSGGIWIASLMLGTFAALHLVKTLRHAQPPGPGADS